MMLVIDPEICDCCDVGISYLVCEDGRRRCRNCTWAFIKVMGYDTWATELLAAAEVKRAEAKAKAEQGPTEHPLVTAHRKKHLVDEAQQKFV